MKRPILLTGAAGDIGTAILGRVNSMGHGVIGLDKINPRNQDKYLQFFKTDLTDGQQLSTTCREIMREHSPLWAFVHCAGLYPIVKVSDYTAELWEEVQAVNVRSAFQIVQELQEGIIHGGRIVLVSSGAAHLGSRDAGYSVSKAGLIGLARALAKSLAPEGILVNAVCPGLISTQMSAQMAPDHFEEYTNSIPLRRPGLPEEVSVCVSFLLAEENSYMTGATLDVNGGLYMR